MTLYSNHFFHERLIEAFLAIFIKITRENNLFNSDKLFPFSFFQSKFAQNYFQNEFPIEKFPRTPRKKQSRTEKDWRISNISKWLLFSSSSAIATGPPCIDATLAGRHARHFSTSVYTWSVFCLDDVDTVSTFGSTRVYRVRQKYVLIPLIPLYIYPRQRRKLKFDRSRLILGKPWCFLIRRECRMRADIRSLFFDQRVRLIKFFIS